MRAVARVRNVLHGVRAGVLLACRGLQEQVPPPEPCAAS